MIEHKDRLFMTPLQVQMNLNNLSKEEVKQFLFECTSGPMIRKILFNIWKDGNHIKKYDIERGLRKIAKNKELKVEKEN